MAGRTIRIATISLEERAWHDFRAWLGRMPHDEVAPMLRVLDASVSVTEEQLAENGDNADGQKAE